MNIKFVKLITGDELIADVSQTEGSFTLKNPIRLMISEQGVAMAPFSPFLGENPVITIKESHMVCTSDIDAEVANAYNQQFGSGIVVASSVPTLKLKD